MKSILSRTPLRVTLGGGGTDVPDFYERSKRGLWVCGCIDKFVGVTLKDRFECELHIRYSKTEDVAKPCLIEHPIVRAVLTRENIRSHVELICSADLPGGSGLGSSGAFTVGLVNTVRNFIGNPIYAQDLAEYAFHVERDELKRPVGKQDLYSAVFGGVQCFEVDRDGLVRSRPLPKDSVVLLQDCLSLVFSGKRRQSETILSKQQSQRDYFEYTQRVLDLGCSSLDALYRGDVEAYGKLMDEYWHLKRESCEGISTMECDALYLKAKRLGVLGGKLVGAGGGGFMLFVSPNKATKLKVDSMFGRNAVQFRFCECGSKVTVHE